MSDYWFKPKVGAVGVTPANWKGWAALAVLGLLILALLGGLILPSVLQGVEPPLGRVLWLVGLETAAIILFLWIAKKKTDGPWRWSGRKGP